MDLPQSIKHFKKTTHDISIIPFPNTKKALAESKRISWKPQKAPPWLKEIINNKVNNNNHKLHHRHAKLKKISKHCSQPSPHLSKNFAQVKKETEIEILELFNFLKDINIPEEINLIDKFNQKISTGEINTIDHMRSFLFKAEELAEYIKLHLRKNEYSKNFMQDVSLDVFEQGFDHKKQKKVP